MYELIVIFTIVVLLFSSVTTVISLNNKAETVTFEVSSFVLEEDKSIIMSNYYGSGIVKCSDHDNTYLVIVDCQNLSVGIEDSRRDSYEEVYIVNGTGELTTYTYMDEDQEKPEYKFKVVGYTKLNEETC